MVSAAAALIIRLVSLGVPKTLARKYARLQSYKRFRSLKRKYKRRPKYIKSFEFGIGYAGGTNVGFNTFNQALFGNFPRSAIRRNYL